MARLQPRRTQRPDIRPQLIRLVKTSKLHLQHGRRPYKGLRFGGSGHLGRPGAGLRRIQEQHLGVRDAVFEIALADDHEAQLAVEGFELRLRRDANTVARESLA